MFNCGKPSGHPDEGRSTMNHDSGLSRRLFLENAGRIAAGGFIAAAAPNSAPAALADETKPTAAAQAAAPASVRPNMTGAYGPWLSETVLGDQPAHGL